MKKKRVEQFILHLKHYNLWWPNGMEIDTRQALMAFPPDNDPHLQLKLTHTGSLLHSVTPDTRHSCQAQFKKLINMPNSLIPITTEPPR